MKPVLKAPGTQRLKLEYHKLIPAVAFNFNLRRCTVEEQQAALAHNTELAQDLSEALRKMKDFYEQQKEKHGFTD